MSGNIQSSEDVARLYERLLEKRDKLRVQLQEAETEFAAVATTLKLMGQPTPGVFGLDLRGMTHLEALVAIAKANDNILVAKQARKLMTRAGMFANSKHASSALFTAINRSGRFRRQSPGKYELIEPKEMPKPSLIPEPVPGTSMRDAIDFDLTPTSHPAKRAL
jgi:hypothetical protein